MCGGSFGRIANIFTNPSANLYDDFIKKDKKGNPVVASAAPDDTKVKEEAKQKQLEASRRSRRSTILTNYASSSSSGKGGKTLLGQ